MATVTKDFRIKSGLVVEGANATVDGSDIITEDALTGGTQTNITVTYDAQTKTVNFVAESGLGDGTTDDLTEGTTNLYFTEQRVEDTVTNNMLGQVSAGSFSVSKDPASGNLAVVAPTTDSVSEGNINLYYTDQRARNAISAAQGAPVTYNGNSGEINFNLGPTSGLEIDTSNYGLSLPDAAANTGSFGSSTEIPVVTVDAKGRVTAVTTSSISTTLGIAGDTGTDSITLGTDTFTVSGGNGIKTSAANNGVNVEIDNGDGLSLTGDGKLMVDAGNGISVDGIGVSVDVSYIAQNIYSSMTNSGLEFDGGAQKLQVNAGNGIELTSEGVSVNTGAGIKIDTQGQVAVNTGYGLTTQMSIGGDTVVVDKSTLVYDIAGDGLEMNGGSMDLQVKTGNGLGINNSTQALQIDLASDSGLGFVTGDLTVNTDGSTIEVDTNNDLSVKYGNGLTVESPFGLVVDTSVIASRSYVDSAVSGLNWKPAVNLLAASNVNLAGDFVGVVIDGHGALTLADAGYRLLLTGQTTDSENGIWVLSDNAGSLEASRPADADAYTELDGAAVFVMEGSQYGSTSWVQSNHYLTDFTNQEWDQFSGQGTYTAGNGLQINGNEFSINDTVVVTHTELDGYLNSTDGTTYVALTGYADTLVATGDPTATPTYLAVDINSIATQVAATYTTTGGSAEVAYEFDDTFRSAKFLVRLARGTHTEISEVLVTLDTADNIAITEYAVVGTNGSLGTISATYDGINEKVQLTVDTPSATTVKVAGTLIA